MPPIRVLFAVGSLEIGGAERRVTRYLRHLDRDRFTPGLYLVARRGPLLAEVPADVPVYVFEERLGPGRLYLPGRVHRRQVRDLAAALDEFSADLLVTRAFHQTLLAGPAVRLRPTPLVAIEASDPRRDFPRQVTRFAGFKKRLIARAYRDAKAVIALSEGAAGGLSEFYGLPRDRISVLPNFVDLDEIDQLAAESGPALHPEQFHVCAVGRLSPEKGADVLLDAAILLLSTGRLPRLHVHFIGDGPLRPALEQVAAKPPLAGHVRVAGALRNPFAYLARCDLFCLPSRYEGMPGALLEAMACRVPVVAADCPSGPREVLDGGRFGRLVPSDDPAALADAIEAAARDPEAARRTAPGARRRIEEEYSVPVGMGRLERLLDAAT